MINKATKRAQNSALIPRITHKVRNTSNLLSLSSKASKASKKQVPNLLSHNKTINL